MRSRSRSPRSSARSASSPSSRQQADDDGVRRMASELAEEEAEHAARLERVLAAEPDPRIDWEKVFDR